MWRYPLAYVNSHNISAIYLIKVEYVALVGTYKMYMHKLILDYFITDQSLQHVSAPKSKPSSGSSKILESYKTIVLIC